ncbi:hypothetical protein OOZ35_00345 [Mesoflavibacter profundi]|uniref:Uncharacterized protein n=1 Tax=Mesoflavibacter profundi TaxID=2708110 RepID=A0ABT4RVK4_9FLAO|nr:hypothetical protein [Mesoflavibacter profundi]MDA0175874.1 hypothetical protein [Mesoflavibacter profundi]MDA0175921.1 hypothetical protein [Mesoflavibacter profundi]MDA0175935.1 hypothetical protein [Mesoflavibacter profundi]
MILKMLTLNNIKSVIITLVIIFAVWYYKDAEKAKADLKVQQSNSEMIRKYDSLRFASVTYSESELKEYLEYQRKDLQDFLQQNDVKLRRIQQIITQQLKYQDTVSRNVNLQPILDAINKNQNIKVPVVDSTRCMIIKGYVAFENDTLSLNITDRKFKNRSDVISYWERNQWRFLGIKTRLFGRKKATVIIKDDCGNTETFVIDKKN